MRRPAHIIIMVFSLIVGCTKDGLRLTKPPADAPQVWDCEPIKAREVKNGTATKVAAILAAVGGVGEIGVAAGDFNGNDDARLATNVSIAAVVVALAATAAGTAFKAGSFSAAFTECREYNTEKEAAKAAQEPFEAQIAGLAAEAEFATKAADQWRTESGVWQDEAKDRQERLDAKSAALDLAKREAVVNTALVTELKDENRSLEASRNEAEARARIAERLESRYRDYEKCTTTRAACLSRADLETTSGAVDHDCQTCVAPIIDSPMAPQSMRPSSGRRLALNPRELTEDGRTPKDPPKGRSPS